MSETTTTASVIAEVAEERERQKAKWGEQNHQNGTGPDVYPMGYSPFTGAQLRSTSQRQTDRRAAAGAVTFTDILLEEVFEALAEVDPDKLRTELIQVAAVATQWVEAIDRAANRCDPSRDIHSTPHVGCILR